VTPGQRIKAAREAKGLTQAQAARAYGCTQPRWAEIEAQRFDPRIETLSRAAQVVGLTLGELFTDTAVETARGFRQKPNGVFEEG